MNFSPKIRYKSFFLILIIFLVVINLPIFSKQTKNFFYSISEPIQKNLWGAGNSFFGFLRVSFNLKEIKNENENLKIKVQELITEKIELSDLRKENNILREALGAGLDKEFNIIPATITAKYLDQDSILINKGLKDGIEENLTVINQQKSLIGRVAEVYENFSKIILISDKKSSFNVEILRNEEGASEDKIFGLIRGNGNLNLSLDLISQEKEIKQNDIIITSSLGDAFLKGFLVGEIEEANKGDLEPFWQVKIKPAFDIKNLETVFIILK